MFIKYPRTEHLLGSKFLDLGNFNLSYKNNEQISFNLLNQSTNIYSIIIEEKMDGIGLGIGFDNGLCYIQHRGHIYLLKKINNNSIIPYYLINFAIWINNNEELLYSILEERYVMFGEWLEYKHTIFYNNLPSYFMEYDIYDKKEQCFLPTILRNNILKNYRQDIHSVHILNVKYNLNLEDIEKKLKNSLFSIGKNSNWQNDLKFLCQYKNLSYNSVITESLNDNLYEGFYIKTETANNVIGRYKWIRQSFFNVIINSQHWTRQPDIKNLLKK